MDRFKSAIPLGMGHEVKLKILAGVQAENRASNRPRANTATLLPQPTDSVVEIAMPEPSLDNYTTTRLQQGLQFVKNAMGRKVTPRTAIFLEIHKEAYKTALDNEDPSPQAQAAVQAMDRAYNSGAFLLKPLSEAEYQLSQALLKLRRMELYANYGDYLAYELKVIRDKMEKLTKSSNVAEQTIGDQVRLLSWKDEVITLEEEQCLRSDIVSACSVLGIDADHMAWLIKEYTARNKTFHNESQNMISTCSWTRLADQLHRDLNELLNIAPDQNSAEHYEKSILHMRGEYFEVIDPDRKSQWLQTDKAATASRALWAKKQKKLEQETEQETRDVMKME